jgi:hypothetical protein
MKDIIKLDTKLADVDSAVLAESEEELQHLSDLCGPGSILAEKYVVEDEKEDKEEDELTHANDFGDNGTQGILV